MDNTHLPAGDGSHHPSEQPQSQSQPPPQPHLPPGFRFHPTDEELVVHYLKRKVQSTPLPVCIIAEIDLYKFDPWELPAKAVFGEQEWYFFSPRDRKYPNGARPNRAATSGYWKATGTDKPILGSGNLKVGVKKALVFYRGKPPRGLKTNWIMHEYRLVDNKPNNKPPGYHHCNNTNKKGSLRLDDWVLCRIYQKSNTNRPMDHHEREDSMEDMLMMGPMSMSMSMSMSNNIGHHHQQHPLSKTPGTLNYTTLLDNQVDQHSNIFDGPMLGLTHGLDPTSSANPLPLKRTALPSFFWGGNGGEDDDTSGAGIGSPSKRVSLLQMSNVDNNNNSSEESGVIRSDQQVNNVGNGNLTSMSSLLNQLPSQTTPATMLDGVFRQPYPLSGLNWYS